MIKQPVKISIYSRVVSVTALLVIMGIYLYMLDKGASWQIYILYALVLVLGGSALIYMPVSISVDRKELRVNRMLCAKKIPLSEIVSIERMQPTMGERRIFASGGWMGYWGRFYERDLGKYFGYYGKASDCFFVRLKDGRGYMLGCKNPDSIVSYVKETAGL